MKLGMIEVSGITRVVEDQKVVWMKKNNRWIKYIGNEIKGGKSEVEMSELLNHKLWKCIKNRVVHKYRIWVHNETINIISQRG